VQAGDLILVADLTGRVTEYSPVVAVPHPRNDDEAQFRVLTTETKRDIKLTGKHLLVAGACDGSMDLMYAEAVTPDHCVQTVDGKERVSSVATTAGRGVYTVVTQASDKLLVVNGVVASPFAVNHAMANAYYGVHRLVYQLWPQVSALPMVSRVGVALARVLEKSLM
jgi:hypothetical protein